LQQLEDFAQTQNEARIDFANMQQVLHSQSRDEIALDNFSWKVAPHDSMPLR
jgi:hypothetical protein